MTDGVLALAWLVALAAAIAGCVLLHRWGVASTYTRDLLHVGTGVWVLGWPLWRDWLVPTLLVSGVMTATLLVPRAAHRYAFAGRIEHTFASGDEIWTGLGWYTLSYAVFSWVGLAGLAFPAAAALLALSLGDGIGGAIGRRFGRHRFRVPGAKTKSLEGSLAVALFAALGVALAAWHFDAQLGLAAILALGVVAAIAEALAPRSTDNLIVPAAVWTIAIVLW